MGQNTVRFGGDVRALAKRRQDKRSKVNRPAAREYVLVTGKKFSHLVRKDAGLASSSADLWKVGHDIALKGGGQYVLHAIAGTFEHHSESLASNPQFGNALAALVEVDPLAYGEQVMDYVSALTRNHGHKFAANPSMGNVFEQLAKKGFAQQAARLFHLLVTLDPEAIAGDEHLAQVIKALVKNGEEIHALETFDFLAENKPGQLAINPLRSKMQKSLRQGLDPSHHSELDETIVKLNDSEARATRTRQPGNLSRKPGRSSLA